MKTPRKVICVCGVRLFEERIHQLIEELKKEAKKHGYFIMVVSANSDSLTDADSVSGDMQFFDFLEELEMSALLVLAESLKFESFVLKITDIGHKKNIPVFCTERTLPGCFNINFDYKQGFEMMVRHIVEHHKKTRVDMIAGMKGNSFSDERIEMYKKVLRDNNIPVETERIFYGDFWEIPTRQAVEDIFNSDLELPEAIVCANDSMAITTCSMLNQRGYTVPDDFLVSGFDGINSSKYSYPAISTCKPDNHSIAKFIVSETENADTTGIFSPKDFDIEFIPLFNRSCGCGREMTPFETSSVIGKLMYEISDSTWHTNAMNHMMTSISEKDSIWDVAEILPYNLKFWTGPFTFACVKSELVNEIIPREEFDEMMVIAHSYQNNTYSTPGEIFKAKDVTPNFKEILDPDSEIDLLLIRSINSGKNVFGYIAQGFKQITTRDLIRFDEFGMFLSDSINSVLHKKRLGDLNKELLKANREITKLSEIDPMTDIYNRRGFNQKLKQLVENPRNKGKYLYLVSIDMDNLKIINDDYGHSAGDFALKTIAKALKKCVSKYGIVSRYGGDEFTAAALLTEPAPYTNESWNDYVNDTIKSIEGVSEKPYTISVSTGFSDHIIDDKLSIDVLTRLADREMYERKNIRKAERGEQKNYLDGDKKNETKV
ncbi:MAG: GGDEF domain-containing protein [Lachnospiraceae bacterium]|nr:GGDEF domain-containing protein [Lachnospiraceae bacterium]